MGVKKRSLKNIERSNKDSNSVYFGGDIVGWRESSGNVVFHDWKWGLEFAEKLINDAWKLIWEEGKSGGWWEIVRAPEEDEQLLQNKIVDREGSRKSEYDPLEKLTKIKNTKLENNKKWKSNWGPVPF